MRILQSKKGHNGWTAYSQICKQCENTMEQLKQYGVILLPICVRSVKLVPEVKKLVSALWVTDINPVQTPI